MLKYTDCASKLKATVDLKDMFEEIYTKMNGIRWIGLMDVDNRLILRANHLDETRNKSNVKWSKAVDPKFV